MKRIFVYGMIGLSLASVGITAAGATYLFAPKVAASLDCAAVTLDASPDELEAITRESRASQRRKLEALKLELRRIKAARQ